MRHPHRDQAKAPDNEHPQMERGIGAVPRVAKMARLRAIASQAGGDRNGAISI
jgi:hypothetical protein